MVVTNDERLASRVRNDADATHDLRPSGRCPLCAAATRTIDRFEFSSKPHLPDAVVLEFCADCDFIFVGGVSASSYRRYYASVRNDANHVIDSDAADSAVSLQTALLGGVLPTTFAGRVLDFGCGQGRLLRALATRFPRASFYGHDVADYMPASPRIRFLPTVEASAERFDVIVLSHVAEHLVGFETLAALERLLTPRGILYLEVPDPRQYVACLRREHMYYFDRLHINHFSARALGRLLGRFGLAIQGTGTHRFRYRDGHYPAIHCTASRSAGGSPTRPSDDVVDASLEAAYRAYDAFERERAERLRTALMEADACGVLVYGSGDNFRRSRRPGGPLHGVRLLALMDRRAAELSPVDGLRCELPAVALARHPKAPVVVTVSAPAEEIGNQILQHGADRRVFFA